MDPLSRETLTSTTTSLRDPPPSNGGKKRKSRWTDDNPKPIGGIDIDPQIQTLNIRLIQINTILLHSGLDQLDGSRPRSLSPDSVYDNLGVRINTREFRARERLNKERQNIIKQLIERNPNFKPPADYRPLKLWKKLYIPMKEYPGYNFIGLIIGPRGNTQKRMEKETGARIVVRGKGSVKDGRFGRKRDLVALSENEDLHVLVEAETREGLDAAVGMVEKLLRLVDEGLNEHKRQQLRELAALNGTVRDEAGYKQFACASRLSSFKSDVLCKICGDGGHPSVDCPVKGTPEKKMDDVYRSFLVEVGGTPPEGVTKQSAPLPIMGSSSGSNGSTGAKVGNGFGVGIGKEIDDTNLYIGYLPSTFEDDALIRLFSPFGDIVMAKVIKDKITGVSKGYGFGKYSDVSEANKAIASMNGYRLDGRVLAVRVAVAGKQPQSAVLPPGPPDTPVPTYAGGYPPQQMTSGGSISAPVPWGPPLSPPPHSYASYPPPPPPPPGSNMYSSFTGQQMQSYGVQYSLPVPQNVSATETASSNVYGNSMAGITQNGQSVYPSVSMSYSSYYNLSPHQPPAPQSVVELPSFASAPWSSIHMFRLQSKLNKLLLAQTRSRSMRIQG